MTDANSWRTHNYGPGKVASREMNGFLYKNQITGAINFRQREDEDGTKEGLATWPQRILDADCPTVDDGNRGGP